MSWRQSLRFDVQQKKRYKAETKKDRWAPLLQSILHPHYIRNNRFLVRSNPLNRGTFAVSPKKGWQLQGRLTHEGRLSPIHFFSMMVLVLYSLYLVHLISQNNVFILKRYLHSQSLPQNFMKNCSQRPRQVQWPGHLGQRGTNMIGSICCPRWPYQSTPFGNLEQFCGSFHGALSRCKYHSKTKTLLGQISWTKTCKQKEVNCTEPIPIS